jgi:hypothetical protein
MHSSKSTFPVRAYIQRFDDVPPDYQLVADELKTRGIPVVFKCTEDIVFAKQPWSLTRDDLVVGNFDWTRLSLERLAITMPQPPDYPSCLNHLLHRRVWESTLGNVQSFLQLPENASTEVFIKPAASAKVFAAIIEPRDQMIDTLISGIPDVMQGLPLSTPVHCSELVDMVSEYRVYIVDGIIRSICQYRGTPPIAGSAITLDITIVNEAVQRLAESVEGRDVITGCGMDFAVMKEKKRNSNDNVDRYTTCLVEVNDGYSLGCYKGFSGKDYTDLLIARWSRLMGHTKAKTIPTPPTPSTTATTTTTAALATLLHPSKE